MAKTLPSDIIAGEILPRLPAKSLIRCKAVCKYWKTLISTPNFSTSHILSSNTNTNNNLLIFTRQNQFLYSFDLEFPESSATKLPLPSGSRVAGSYNGLLCLFKSGAKVSDDEIFLSNPSTRAFQVIPQAPTPPQFNLVQVIMGFGYDPGCDDYNIIRMFFYGVSPEYNLRWFTVVYSLRANSWKIVEDKPCNYTRVEKSAVLDGHLIHWLCSAINGNTPRSEWIDCFDVCDEKWSEISLPDSSCGFESRALSLGVIQKCLCLLNGRTDDGCVEVWVLKEYGVTESWVKLFDVVGASPHDGVLGCRDGGNEILLPRGCRKRLFWYNSVNQTANDFEMPGVPDIWGVHMCKGTLIGVGGDQVVIEKKESLLLKISRHARQFFLQHPRLCHLLIPLLIPLVCQILIPLLLQLLLSYVMA